MTKLIFWADIEYSNLDETESGEGGFVYAFINALDIQTARQSLTDALRRQRKTIKELRQLTEYDSNTSWDNEDLETHYKSLVNLTRQTDYVTFDTFYAYDKIE